MNRDCAVTGKLARLCATMLGRPHPLRAALEKARNNGALPSARRGFDGRRGQNLSGRGAQLLLEVASLESVRAEICITTIEKGTLMNYIEHSAEKLSVAAGFRAVLRACVRLAGSGAPCGCAGAPSPARLARRLLIALICAIPAAALCSAAPALAATVPTVETEAIHALVGENIVVYGRVNGNGADTHYHFEYVTGEQFNKQGSEGGFARAASTPEKDAGEGGRVYAQLSGLQPGASYHFRIAAENSADPGAPQYSADRTLAVPAPAENSADPGAPQYNADRPLAVRAAAEAQPSCPNEALRTGPSAHLPDCRAYEQVTPSEKGGATNEFTVGSQGVANSAIGEDGNHYLLWNMSAKWGSNVSANASAYSFSRTPAGWQMTSLFPQPETGIFKLEFGGPDLTPDLSQVLLKRSWEISEFSRSPEEELILGPPGGPYATVASTPTESSEGTQWVTQSRDGSVAVLRSEIRELLPGHPTPTTQGADFYQYADGRLSQLNVDSEGNTIGTCGAQIPLSTVEGTEGTEPTQHAVSADGRRFLFEADAGPGCSESSLYMRVGGAKTVDIGAYRLLGSDPEDSRLILQRGSEYFVYHTETETFEPLPKLNGQTEPPLRVSEDANVIYFGKAGDDSERHSIYRYDIETEKLNFVANFEDSNVPLGGLYTSPDGSDFYWSARHVEGVPGGFEEERLSSGGAGGGGIQVFRYDSAEEVIQCVACASTFNPNPYPDSVTLLDFANDGEVQMIASANGDYVFFDTVAALVPSDVNGEIEGDGFNASSASSDVYEWRRNGIDGCTHVQGCLALISERRRRRRKPAHRHRPLRHRRLLRHPITARPPGQRQRRRHLRRPHRRRLPAPAPAARRMRRRRLLDARRPPQRPDARQLHVRGPRRRHIAAYGAREIERVRER